MDRGAWRATVHGVSKSGTRAPAPKPAAVAGKKMMEPRWQGLTLSFVLRLASLACRGLWWDATHPPHQVRVSSQRRCRTLPFKTAEAPGAEPRPALQSEEQSREGSDCWETVLPSTDDGSTNEGSGKLRRTSCASRRKCPMGCPTGSLAAVSSQDKLTGATFQPFSSCSDSGEAKNSGNFNGERSLRVWNGQLRAISQQERKPSLLQEMWFLYSEPGHDGQGLLPVL